ncbi:MAG: hypothetical protein ACJ8KU_01885 [Chthoniobacterales bacterium]
MAAAHETADDGHENGRPRYAAVGDGEANELDRLEAQWAARLSYPTGRFNPAWVRAAAKQDASLIRSIPSGRQSAQLSLANSSAVALSIGGFTSLGPQPLRMTGCTDCYDYGNAAGRVNAIAVDPATTTSGSIIAYAATVGGGVWKTTSCCTGSTTWSVTTDDPLLGTTSIDALAIDPNDHNTIYAGTGDLNYGSFSMGSQGILKTSDGGASWKLFGQDVFGAALPEPAGQFPQYQAVGKLRVDPNYSNRVVAGTKTGLYISYNAGSSWTGPCTTNGFTSQRQDITGLELTNMGSGVTRIVAAVGVRGFATTVQYNLDQNGANGVYRGTMPDSGCPSDFTLISRNDNGFGFGTQVTGSPYATADAMNAGSGIPFGGVGAGNQLGRIDLAIAPTNPNYIYAQVQSIAPNDNTSCANKPGCQLGVWASVDGGESWSFLQGSAGGSLRSCDGTSGDDNQNWYDQVVAVDPDNPDRIFVGTYDIWLAARNGTNFYDLTCGYDYASAPVHVDQHALTLVPGSAKLLLAGNDGGIFGSSDSNNAVAGVARNTWFNMDGGLNTIEFYSGDISGNFAASGTPQAVGGAQDNGTSAVAFSGSPAAPTEWQGVRGGDGFYARIDPVGTGSNLRYWAGQNDGALYRCVSDCTNAGASWSNATGGWAKDTKSFILPYDLFHGGIPGGDDCPSAGTPGGCGHLIAGTTRVWETTSGGASFTPGWYVTNNPSTQNMTKQALGDRSFINQVKYSPKFQSVAIAGTNDGNVWIGFNLGTGISGQAAWIDVTGGNIVLPNRPVLGIAMDPSSAAPNLPAGYAAIGGFNANTPGTPGHVFAVSCTSGCSSFGWANKSGNLPDIPVDSIIVNPKYPQQVFAGTDFGLYYTDDITASAPVWNKFTQGLPNVMIWDMQIDRGSTTLSVWTRGRGAFVWPLPSGGVPKPSPSTRALNISTRLDVGTGENQAIGGFIVSGSSAKRVLVRAIGPSLAQAGVSGALLDPVLELHAADGSLIGANDNWRDPDAAAIAASGIPPNDDRESAIIATVAPGNYTAVVSGKSGSTGIGLVEAYDLDASSSPSNLANISTRGVVQTGGKVVIGGFILGDASESAQILIRGLGPSLAQQGVVTAVSDTTLELRDSQGTLLVANDDWKDDLAQADAIRATGIPPQNDREAAVVKTLSPGAYTAILAGKNGATGVGIVEIYNLSSVR